MYRTDKHNNPTAFTTDIAEEAKLVRGVDYEVGDPFTVGTHIYYTAKLLKDPIATTISVIDKLGFYNAAGRNRWSYMGLPKSTWQQLVNNQKIYIIAFMYRRELGTDLVYLFPSGMTQRLEFDKIPKLQ